MTTVVAGGKASTETPTPETKVETPAAETKVETKVETPAAETKVETKVETPAAETKKAPDAYALLVPDTAKDLVSPEDLKYLETVARASDWTNEEAQAELASLAERAQASIAAKSATWLTAAKADTEIGGDQFDTTSKHVKAVLDRFLPDTLDDGKVLRAAMNATGYGNFPPLVKLLARIGKAMAEDSPALGRLAGEPKDATAVLYDHATSKV